MSAYGGWWGRAAKVAAGTALAAVLLAGCGHLMMMMGGDVEPPPASQFGMGPRRSVGGRYDATIEPASPLKVGRMQSVKLVLRTPGDEPVEAATFELDGGMPQHGHGLPTTPRVTRSLGGGAYQVEGLRFNMGGWWELKFRIDSPAGADSVTFNLDL